MNGNFERARRDACLERACAIVATMPRRYAWLVLAVVSCRPTTAGDGPVCPEVPPPAAVQGQSSAPPLRPAHLSVVLEGPYDELDAVLSERQRPLPDDCDPLEPDAPTSPYVVDDVALAAPVLGARLIRYPGDIACAPIEYCALAVRTASGWWITAHDDNAWCHGVTGPSSRIELTNETLDVDPDHPTVLIHDGTSILHMRSYGRATDGRKQESWSESRAQFSRRCEVTADDRVHCQVLDATPVP